MPNTYERRRIMDKEKVAHDLAVLYMQMEIKHEEIVPTVADDFPSFVNEYQHCYSEILHRLKEA